MCRNTEAQKRNITKPILIHIIYTYTFHKFPLYDSYSHIYIIFIFTCVLSHVYFHMHSHMHFHITITQPITYPTTIVLIGRKKTAKDYSKVNSYNNGTILFLLPPEHTGKGIERNKELLTALAMLESNYLAAFPADVSFIHEGVVCVCVCVCVPVCVCVCVFVCVCVYVY